MENINEGLLLMVVGMITVFIILLVVINLGKLLISLVNKYAPDETPAAPKPSTASSDTDLIQKVISAAVEEFTHGKGHVQQIEKI